MSDTSLCGDLRNVAKLACADFNHRNGLPDPVKCPAMQPEHRVEWIAADTIARLQAQLTEAKAIIATQAAAIEALEKELAEIKALGRRAMEERAHLDCGPFWYTMDELAERVSE